MSYHGILTLLTYTVIGNGGRIGNLKYGKEGPTVFHMDLRLN
jgi:hypothetical protein